ncbi:MAG: hypothetical protein HY332_15690 [Chloroflexi bacterium]|nr:hypothetical protein [Chloroflexota bacterium]
MDETKFTIEEVCDSNEIARFRAHDDRARRNGDWLQAHWDKVLPQARGRFLAVAGQEAFIADSPEEVGAMAATAHPEDDAVLVQYVRPALGPRISAHRW